YSRYATDPMNFDLMYAEIGSDGLAQDIRQLAAQPGTQGPSAVVDDGVGGGLAAWIDPRSGGTYPDIYASRVWPAASCWPADGTKLASSVPSVRPVIVPDGAGGALVIYANAGPYDVYAKHAREDG